MTREPLTDSEQLIVREGLAAASLLASEPLQLIIKSLMVEAFATITDSSPEQLPKREDQYNLIRGLKAIEAELESRIQRKDAIERRLDAEASDDDANDPLIDDAYLGVQTD